MIADEKKVLRNQLLTKLLSLTKEEIKRRSHDVEKILSSLLLYKQAKCIMIFYPLKGEVDLLGIVRKARGKRFCFPVIEEKTHNLKPFEVNDLENDFVKGPYGVLQPDIAHTKEVNIKDIDLVIVPGLAFDEHRHRLGRGAGFYDRFLKRLSASTSKVGVAFTFQIMKSLPVHSAFDQQVDTIASEDRLI